MTGTTRSVIFCAREVTQICKTMANAYEIDQDAASLFGDSGDEESFDGFGEGGFSSDNDSDLDFEGLDAEEDAPDPEEAQVPQPSHDTDDEEEEEAR